MLHYPVGCLQMVAGLDASQHSQDFWSVDGFFDRWRVIHSRLIASKVLEEVSACAAETVLQPSPLSAARSDLEVEATAI